MSHIGLVSLVQISFSLNVLSFFRPFIGLVLFISIKSRIFSKMKKSWADLGADHFGVICGFLNFIETVKLRRLNKIAGDVCSIYSHLSALIFIFAAGQQKTKGLVVF